MTELFRFIEHAFALPAPAGAIDVGSESLFQTNLRNAIAQNEPPDHIRSIVNELLNKQFPTIDARPFALASELLSFSAQLLALASPTQESVKRLVETLFGTNAQTLVASTNFVKDKQLLNDTLVGVKLVTAFDRVNAADLVTMRKAMAFLEDLAAERMTDFAAEGIQTAMHRPIRIPKIFIDSLKISSSGTPRPAPPDPAAEAVRRQSSSLLSDQHAFQSAYETIMTLQPHEFELKPFTIQAGQTFTSEPDAEPASPGESASGHAVDRTKSIPAAPMFLVVPQTVIERLDAGVRQTLEKASIDIANAPVSHVIASIKRHWQDVSHQLAPYQISAPSPVFRVGLHLFAIQATPAVESDTQLSELFRRAITRPVGLGDLQVVRQELIGYEAREISHIENVLEGELLKRSTRREEVNELTITQETSTTQIEERDQQSTSRSELATEAQKEASQQTTSVKDHTTTTDYGKLVENSKTNYARSVTDRAVNSLTQMVKLQRVQREKKTFTEDAQHEFDNRDKTKKVRGIYQWVDKKYKTRVLNLGKRLLYDVVIPEPAAFLIDSLKKATQPENFQLTKPVYPTGRSINVLGWYDEYPLKPTDLNPSNYMDFSAQYGVTGSVTPPPDEFIRTVAYPIKDDVSGTIGDLPKDYFNAFQIPIPDNYKALSGYIRGSYPNRRRELAAEDGLLEFTIGEHFQWWALRDTHIYKWFKLTSETGAIPVTMRTANVFQFNFAIGIYCQRTDTAYEQWQLKTHATIVSGYQRQLAEYQDKLNQYLTAISSQMALSKNYAHDPSIEQEELKKAFIFLLLGEHFLQAFHPTPNPHPTPDPSSIIPPNPTEVRDWGAMVAFFERAFEWENMMYIYYPYFWGRQQKWHELILIQDINPQFEAFLKAGAARIIIPVRPGFEGALAHYQETGDIWMGEEIPDMFSEFYVSIIEEVKARNFAPGKEVCVSEWDVKLPTTLVMLNEDETLPKWQPTEECSPRPDG